MDMTSLVKTLIISLVIPIFIISCGSSDTDDSKALEVSNTCDEASEISTSDSNLIVCTFSYDKSIAVQEVLWWYPSDLWWTSKDEDTVINSIECKFEQCSMWGFPSDISGPIYIQVNNNVVTKEDEQCWDTFHGYSYIDVDPNYSQKIDISLYQVSTICDRS